MLRNKLERRDSWHDSKNCIRSFKSFDYFEIFYNFAEAGFYFEQKKDQGVVQCICCEVRTTDWLNIKDPLIFHSLKNPSCPFLTREFGLERIFNICENYARNFDQNTFECNICFVNQVDRFLYCGHVFCRFCLEKLENCPTCRETITFKNDITGVGQCPE